MERLAHGNGKGRGTIMGGTGGAHTSHIPGFALLVWQWTGTASESFGGEAFFGGDRSRSWWHHSRASGGSISTGMAADSNARAAED